MLKLLHPSLLSLLEILPLPVFLIYAETIDKSVSAQWLDPYLLSSAIAILTSGYLIRQGIRLNRVILGINLYLYSGALGLLLKLSWLNHFYGKIEAAGMLFWILAISLASLCHSRGLFGKLNPDRKKSDKDTWIFIFLLLIACLTSLFFQGNRLIAEILPFILVFTSYGIFRNRADATLQGGHG